VESHTGRHGREVEIAAAAVRRRKVERKQQK
jgi:hypothetical protein